MAYLGKPVEKARHIGAKPELVKRAQEMLRTNLGKGEFALLASPSPPGEGDRRR